ncbi:hypothetical protein HYC85_028387 [Camellia sinensis]|uniref:Retrotransposon gag domain-containing protein n=1 Tax=Camellia sinensis TaxID=4442 RepID=A0A7J7FZ17_CAMSI|nr:hypothetical protein HYC85_028387 [Camellia sinensis]
MEMVRRSRTEAHGQRSRKIGNRAPKWAKWPTATKCSPRPLRDGIRDLSPPPPLKKRNRENRVWFANRGKAQKRVRKSGGRARSHDSETSEQAQHEISPSAQLSARTTEHGRDGGNDASTPRKYETHAAGRCPPSRICQAAGCDHSPAGRPNHQVAIAKRSICFASSSSTTRGSDTRGNTKCPGKYGHSHRAGSPPILPQLSKTPTNLPDSPFEFEVDPMALKLNKLEKLFKKSQGVKSIPDIEDGYTDAAVMLPDRFKMPHIDRFDGSRDPIVHLRLFSDIPRPMGLTRLQKLSLFGRTLSGVATIWYAKLEDDVKRNWDEMTEAFIIQYSYNTPIEITTRDLKTTGQEPKESFSDFVTRWRAKASMMTIRPTDKDQIRMVVRNLQPKLMQKMIVLPFPTFSDSHEMGVQIEDALKQGLIDNDRE